MAVKNTSTKNYAVSFDDISAVLRSPDFCKCMDAEFLEEAILPSSVEFRYKRKSTVTAYGRNYFIAVKSLDKNLVNVAVTTQSRKVTVLLDTSWKKEVEKAFGFIEMLLRRKG